MKILAFDVETSPHTITSWGTYDTNALRVDNPSYMLCFAYRWMHEKKTHVVGLDDYTLYNQDPTDDYCLARELHKLYEEADVVVAHNVKFDDKQAKAKMLLHGFDPPSPVKTVCTLQWARRHFKLYSNRLDALGELLGLGRKEQHEGLSLWFKCMSTPYQAKAWRDMKSYCKQDVDLLCSVYEKLRPWGSHPNVNENMAGLKCPKCSSKHLQSRGSYRTITCSYQRYQCQSCGAWTKNRKADKHNKPEVVAIV